MKLTELIDRAIPALVAGLLAFLLLLILSLLTGCAEFDAARAGVARHGATAADTALDVARWEVCTAATVGALERELGSDKTRTLGWLLFCDKKPGHPLSPSFKEGAKVEPQGRELQPGDASMKAL